MIAPPDYVIEAARLAASQSPCAKSKRGVVLFSPENALAVLKDGIKMTSLVGAHGVIVASGLNGPPRGFDCKNTMVCRGSCAQVCMHAEQRAIMAALGCDDVVDLELVHVKVIDSQVVAGGGPSCLQCSRLVVEVGLRGVWLFESPSGIRYTIESASAPGVWRFYRAREFHLATLASHDLRSLGVRSS